MSDQIPAAAAAAWSLGSALFSDCTAGNATACRKGLQHMTDARQAVEDAQYEATNQHNVASLHGVMMGTLQPAIWKFERAEAHFSKLTAVQVSSEVEDSPTAVEDPAPRQLHPLHDAGLPPTTSPTLWLSGDVPLGLGNQLFRYASARAIAATNRCKRPPRSRISCASLLPRHVVIPSSHHFRGE